MNVRNKNMSRRNFLAGAGTVGALSVAGVMAGCSPSGGSAGSGGSGSGNGYMPNSWDEEAEVVVVGAGGAGCAAAYAAAVAGAKVLVIESQSNNAFTSTSVCGGYIMFVGSDEQKALGIDDSNEKMLEDTLEWGKTNKKEVIQTFLDHNLEYYQILKEIGVEVDSSVVFSPGCKTPRTHYVNPADHQQKIYQAAEEAGAEFSFGVTGKRFFVNGEGTVCGVSANKGSREIAIKASKAVIVCTGGFTWNAEMLEECMPGLSEVAAHSCAGHTGDCHYACFELGGQYAGRPYMYAVEGMAPGSTTMDHYAELYIYGAIKVNTEGDRYVDEGLYWCNAMTRAQLEQPKKDERYFNWQIIDQTAYDLAKAAGRPLGVYDTNESDFVSGATIEELAEKIGAPNLAATVAKYNEDVVAGTDTLFGRTTLCGEGTGDLIPLSTPPYYAFPNEPWLAYNPATTFYTDEECRLLNQYDEPIGNDRLYLAGEIMLKGIVGNHYQYGLAVGASCTYGMYIGKKVAEFDSWE